jgi:hypothetical protein
MESFAAETATPAMCTAWRLFRDHGANAEELVQTEYRRCLSEGDAATAATWLQVAEALTEWIK